MRFSGEHVDSDIRPGFKAFLPAVWFLGPSAS